MSWLILILRSSPVADLSESEMRDIENAISITYLSPSTSYFSHLVEGRRQGGKETENEKERGGGQ
jgi:hypothetical protein